MATLADSLVSASGRKLPVRKRPDLSARLQRYQGRSYWVVKDPVGLNYFRFQEEEFAILNMLDGRTSLDEIKERFEAEFPPQKITVEEVQQFIGMLHRSGLVITAAPGQGEQLLKRRVKRRRQELIGAFTNILSIRFKGVDPNRFLDWLYTKIRFLFSPAAQLVWILTVLSALTLVLVQFDVFQSKLPAFHQFFGPKNWIWLGMALALSKVLHELGHGLSCKHFGGECHEIGVMILVLTPCLYCNVSDSWMLPSKWRRAMIGAAGMYVEVFLASVATFIWWTTQDETLINKLALSTMFVCSVSTLIFNGNPLLRYDGYYILADLVEIPNLRQKATKILSSKLGKWCLGLEEQEDPFLPKRNHLFFALYSVAAVCYRWFVLLSILYFLYKVFEPYRLEIIGKAIALTSLYGLIVMPAWKVGKFFYVPGRIEKVKKPRMYATLALLTAVVLAILLIPLPHKVSCVVEIRPRGAEQIYADPGGILSGIEHRPGDTVDAGMMIAKLENVDVELRIASLQGEEQELKQRLRTLGRMPPENDAIRSQIPEVRAQLDTVRNQLQKALDNQSKLSLKAPIAGTVLPPPVRPQRPEVEGVLPTWTGTPLEVKNIGATLAVTDHICQVGDPSSWEAVLVIDQGDIEFVAAGARVVVRLEELPQFTFETTVGIPSSEPMEFVSPGLASLNGGPIPSEADQATGRQRPQSKHYQASTAELDRSKAPLLRVGLQGFGRIDAGYRTLGERAWRFIRQTFSFTL